MKTALKIILLLGVVGYLIYAIIGLSRSEEDYICQGIEIAIQDSTRNTFLDSEFVRDILAENKISPEGSNISQIDLYSIEKAVGANTYIDSVLCYFTAEHNLCISVIPRVPIMHIMTASGQDFYMDAKGHTMPGGEFNLDLCLITGNVNAELCRKNLIPLAMFLRENPRWNSEIEQIIVKDAHHIYLIPKSGDFQIGIGEANNMAEKMQRLDTFIHEGLDKAGWNKYGTVDVSYDGQVVCTKKKQ